MRIYALLFLFYTYSHPVSITVGTEIQDERFTSMWEWNAQVYSHFL